MERKKDQTVAHPQKVSRSNSTPIHNDELSSVELVLRQHLKKLVSWFLVWRSWQKRIFLCNLVENCSVGQLKLLATALEPIFHIDFTTVFTQFTEANESASLLNAQYFVVRRLTQQNLKEIYDTHPTTYDNISCTTDNATTSGGSVCFSKDTQSSPVTVAKSFRTFSTGDGQTTLLPLSFPRFHKRHQLSLGSSNYVSEDFYSFARKRWQESGGERNLHRYRKSKSVIIKPSVTQLTEQFKDQLCTVSKWIMECNEQQVSKIMFHIVKMCDSELLIYLTQCLYQKLKAIPPIDRIPDKLMLNILQYLGVTSLCRASQVCSRWKRLCDNPSLWAYQCKLLGHKEASQKSKYISSGIDWKQTCKDLYLLKTNPIILLEADVQETDQDEADSSEQPRVTSTALKMQMTLRSMLDLVRRNCSLDSMATTQDVLRRAPESAAAMRRRLRAERKGETGQKDIDMLTQESSFLINQILTDKSSFGELGTLFEKQEQNAKSEKTKRTRLYPPTNPYALVAVALDIRPVISSVASHRGGLHALELAGYMFQDDLMLQPGVVEPFALVKRILTENGAILCVQWDVRKIIIGTADQSIQINDMRSSRLVATLMGHKGGVHCLQFDQDILVTGSWDKTCLVWDVVHFNVIGQLQGHTERVSCLKFDDTILVTGSHDCTIRVWDLVSFSCITTISAHQGPVTCLDYNDKMLMTGSSDKYVKAWSRDTYTQLGVMLHHHPVTALIVSNLLCISATCEGTVIFWNLKSFGKLFSCVLADNPYVTSMSLSGAQCYVAATNGVLYEIDIISTLCTRKLKGHSTSVNKVQAGPNRIVTVSDDQTICVWFKRTVASQPSDAPPGEAEFDILPVQLLQP